MIVHARPHRRGSLYAATLIVAGLAGTLSCGGDGSTAPTPPPPPPVATSLTVSPATAELDAVGATVQLSAEVFDQNGQTMSSAAVTWSSGDESVATVDGTGLVTAVAEGETAVTATSGSASGSAAVSVSLVPVPPEPVGTMPDQELDMGQAATADAAEYFNDPDGGDLSYAATSSDSAVATADISGSEVTVTGVGLGTATVTVTAIDPDGLSATQSFRVVVSGSVEDDFDSPASLNDWEIVNAEAAVADGVLNLTNRTEGRLGIAKRREMPAVNEWTIQARMGRITRRASPGVVSLTGHGRFTAVRLVLRTLDDAATTTASRNYEFAVFDGAAGEWLLVRNLSGASESVLEEPGEFTDLALGHESGDFVAYAGEAGAAEELFRFDLATSEVDGVGLGDIVSDMTGLWLVNQGAPGLTAQHDRVSVTGTGSDATPPDGAGIADAPDAATRSFSVAGPDADRAALVTLYEATDGPNWANSDNWLTDAPLGQWYGVTVNARGRVTRLELAGRWDSDARAWVRHGLSGPIPPEIGDLDNLSHLELGTNNLSGPIPEGILRLTNLDTLDLGDNSLTGPIPPALGDLTGLKFLSLAVNELTGPIPPELGNLPDLELLQLGWNNLSGPIPPELGRLTTLRERLNLNKNALSGPIPPELGQLATVQILNLSDNNLTGPIPPELGNLDNLIALLLGGNNLSGSIPPELGSLASLQWVGLENNELTGPIPPELGDPSLKYLKVNHNGLTDRLPSSLLGLPLDVFWWSNNAGLCAPDTGAFRTWFGAIDDHVPGPFCSSGTP